MRIYLDMCSIQRPLDDQTQLRIHVEAEAVLGIIAFCEAGGAELISSEALEYETARNPHPVRKAHAQGVLGKATRIARLSPAVEARARLLNQAGIKPLDALHLAFAVEAGAGYFCTCDDRFLRRARTAHSGAPKVVSPLELLTEEPMTVQTKPLAEVTRRAIEILSRELGAADTLRFMGQFTSGYGDYTEERDALFGQTTLDDLLSEIKAAPQKHA